MLEITSVVVVVADTVVLVAGVSVGGIVSISALVVVVGAFVDVVVVSCLWSLVAAAFNNSMTNAGIVDDSTASFSSSVTTKPSISVTWSNLALTRDSVSGHLLQVAGHTFVARYSCP